MASRACPVNCSCHAGGAGSIPCDVPGGCGSEGCGRENAVACITCAIYWPRKDATDERERRANIPHRPPVCNGCRWRISRQLADIANHHDDLTNPPPVEVDDRWYAADYQLWNYDEKRWDTYTEDRRADPVAAVGGVAPIPSKAKRPNVSGSRERPAPTSLDRLDLTGLAHRFNATRDENGNTHQKPDDADGLDSAASVLDSWVRDLRDQLWPDIHLPDATVAELVCWLRAGADFDQPGVRIDEACDAYPEIADFAAEVLTLWRALRRATGATEPQPEILHGVACQRCDRRTLIRRPGDTYRAECTSCGQLMTDDEFASWRDRLAGYERSTRDPDEVRELMRLGSSRRVAGQE